MILCPIIDVGLTVLSLSICPYNKGEGDELEVNDVGDLVGALISQNSSVCNPSRPQILFGVGAL
jgi:hypothetical protein